MEFSRELLGLVPKELAHSHCLIPIYVRQVRGGGDSLFVAMDDPTNEQLLEEIAELAGLPVKAMVAPPTDIRDAIGVYYFGTSPSTAVETMPEEYPSEPAPSSDDAEATNEESTDDAEVPEAKEPESGGGPRLVTLTMLDGTQNPPSGEEARGRRTRTSADRRRLRERAPRQGRWRRRLGDPAGRELGDVRSPPSSRCSSRST